MANMHSRTRRSVMVTLSNCSWCSSAVAAAVAAACSRAPFLLAGGPGVNVFWRCRWTLGDGLRGMGEGSEGEGEDEDEGEIHAARLSHDKSQRTNKPGLYGPVIRM